ncbi:hypothetical protein, partial [Streptomyces sp. NPDC005266]
VDFWHAVEFSRNGRFLRNRFTGFSGRFPSVFPTLPDPFSVPFPVRIPFLVAAWRALPFGVFSTLADPHLPNLIGFATVHGGQNAPVGIRFTTFTTERCWIPTAVDEHLLLIPNR